MVSSLSRQYRRVGPQGSNSQGRIYLKNDRRSSPKENTQPRSYRFYPVMNCFAIISILDHLTFTGVFYYLQLWDLAIYMSFATFLWLGIFILNRRGNHRFAFLLGILETFTLAALSSFILGWQSGFFLYIFAAVLLIFVNTKVSTLVQILLGVFAGVLVLYLFVFSPSGPVLGIIDRYLTAMNIMWLVLIFAFTGHYFEVSARGAEAELLSTNRKLLNLATTDPVTNLINRRNMILRIEQEKEKLNLNGRPFALIMIDIDNFKHVNDAYGHDCGDFVLVAIAETISLTIRKQDLVARWGGDEFLVMLPETDIEGGRVVAEKIRSRILRTPFVYHELDIPVTLTLGVGLCDRNIGIGNCIRKADQALYDGKQAGKNRVTVAE